MTDYAEVEDVNHRRSGDDAGQVSAAWDQTIAEKITEVSRDIDRMVGIARGDRSFKFVADAQASVRTFRGRGRAVLYIADCVEISSIATRSRPSESLTELAADDWIAASGSPIVSVERVDRIFDAGGLVAVEARWGYGTSVRADVREATVIEVIRSFLGDQAGNDDRLGMSPFGSVITAKAFTSKLRQLVNDYAYGGASLRY